MFRTGSNMSRGHSSFLNTIFTTRRGRSRFLSPYEQKLNNECAKILGGLFFLIIFFGAPILLFTTEVQYRDMKNAFGEVAKEVVSVNAFQSPSPQNNGKLIYFHVPKSHSENVINPDKAVEDHDFGLRFDGAIEVKRVTEYCQWIETYSDDEYTDSQGSKHTKRTYYYHKGWVRHPIISLLFDQPAAHHNPQRDPFPSYMSRIDGAEIANGNYHLPAPLIDNHRIPSRRINAFTRDALRSAGSTPANNHPHNFRYIGDGYFFSAYHPDTATTLLRTFGQWLEGSLLDWQIGDLLSNCEAGDIRISFEQSKPLPGKGISVIAAQLDGKGQLGLYQALNGFKVGFLHEGSYNSVTEMFDQELSFHRWGPLLMSKLGIIVWGLAVALVFGGDYVSSFTDIFICTCTLSSLFQGIIWILVYGITSSGGWLCMIASIASFYILTVKVQPSERRYETPQPQQQPYYSNKSL